jgi:hypothetical protein
MGHEAEILDLEDAFLGYDAETSAEAASPYVAVFTGEEGVDEAKLRAFLGKLVTDMGGAAMMPINWATGPDGCTGAARVREADSAATGDGERHGFHQQGDQSERRYDHVDLLMGRWRG